MHVDCPDYDLCEGCEALPLPVHPRNHPMLKIRLSDVAIPNLYASAQRSVDAARVQELLAALAVGYERRL